jgi:hypothetical protein
VPKADSALKLQHQQNGLALCVLRIALSQADHFHRTYSAAILCMVMSEWHGVVC